VRSATPEPPTLICVRRALEEGAPTLLLAGSKQLLELARVEATPAAESYVTLAARVLSHGAGAYMHASACGAGAGCWLRCSCSSIFVGSYAHRLLCPMPAPFAAARCLDLKRSTSGEAMQSPQQQEQPRCGAAAEAAEEDHDPYAALAAIDVRALELGAASDSDSGSATPAGARDISPAGTLDTVSPGMNVAFASGRTGRGVSSLAGRACELPAGRRTLACLPCMQTRHGEVKTHWRDLLVPLILRVQPLQTTSAARRMCQAAHELLRQSWAQ
jgi:hypothetical protein